MSIGEVIVVCVGLICFTIIVVTVISVIAFKKGGKF